MKNKMLKSFFISVCLLTTNFLFSQGVVYAKDYYYVTVKIVNGMGYTHSQQTICLNNDFTAKVTFSLLMKKKRWVFEIVSKEEYICSWEIKNKLLVLFCPDLAFKVQEFEIKRKCIKRVSDDHIDSYKLKLVMPKKIRLLKEYL